MNEKEFKDYIDNNIETIISKISLEEINFLGDLINAFNKVCEKYDKAQNNWNELKKWLEEQKEFIEDIPTFTLEITHNHFGMVGAYKNTLSKMQELEQGKDE